MEPTICHKVACPATSRFHVSAVSADSYLPRQLCELCPVAADDPLAEVVVVDGGANPALGLLMTEITLISSPESQTCVLHT